MAPMEGELLSQRERTECQIAEARLKLDALLRKQIALKGLRGKGTTRILLANKIYRQRKRIEQLRARLNADETSQG